MSNDWRIILRFAALGLATTALYLAYQVLTDSSSRNNSSDAVFIVLCPASVLLSPLFAWFFEAAEVGTALFLGFMVVRWINQCRVVCVRRSGLRGFAGKAPGPPGELRRTVRE